MNEGRYRSSKGYWRISSGEHRNKYEHRAVIEKMLVNPIGLCFVGCGGEIPEGLEVHHIDEIKVHNCQGNLMLLQKEIHSSVTNARVRWIKENYDKWFKWYVETEQASREERFIA